MNYLDDEAISDALVSDATWMDSGGYVWGIDVKDGVAYTCILRASDDEIQHVQDFFAGKYCKLRGHVSNDCLAGPEQFGNWSK